MPRTNNSIRSIDLTRAILEHPETGAFYYIKEGRLTTVVNREIGLEPVKYRVMATSRTWSKSKADHEV